MKIPEEITTISRLKTDFEKFKALFILLDTDFRVSGSRIYCEDKRYDFGPKTGDLTNIVELNRSVVP